jgi:hypothetical protein
MKSGSGTHKYANGDMYVGEYKNDKKHGMGLYTFKNGSQYEVRYETLLLD